MEKRPLDPSGWNSFAEFVACGGFGCFPDVFSFPWRLGVCYRVLSAQCFVNVIVFGFRTFLEFIFEFR